MMPNTAHYKSFVFFSSIIWFTGSVIGEFTSPPLGVTYEREFTTIEIPWKFTYDGQIIQVTWYYTKRGESSTTLIYNTNGKGEPKLDGVGKNQFTGRVKLKGVLNRKDATLAIKAFTKEDEGDFRCEINGRELIQRTVTLRASVLSNVTEFRTVNDSEIVEGDNVTLSCTTSEGEPSPKIEIRREGQVLNKTTASNKSETTLLYHFEPISKAHSGSYSCRVITYGYTSERNVQFKVLYPPEFARTVKAKLFGCIGKQITIDCQASGEPKPSVRIIGLDGKRIANKFTLRKFGKYRCEASNKLGNKSLNITINKATEKPEELSFSECKFDKLTWQESSDQGVKYTLQVRAREGSTAAWDDIITSIDTAYSPSTNESFNENKDYEFRVVASNCVGSTESKVCVVEGKNPTSEERSSDGSNAGVIAGSVIAVLAVILIIVIVAVCWRKRKRESPSVKYLFNKKKGPVPDDSSTKISQKPGGLLYSDSPNMDAARVRPPVEYRQDDDDFDEYSDDDNDPDQPNGPSLSGNVPSWV